MDKMKPIQTHVLKAFRILDIPGKPKIAAVAFQTAAGGRHRFVANRDMITRLAAALIEHAKKMPAPTPDEAKEESQNGPGKDPQDWFNA
jgi:hypothetical protein